ncbi:MAG TPA: serine hydrolase domain-containing protein, partial [Candidatus Baltobacteraceae bacterium]|nr:serine hydrolase domain-containing protein [Candidatus Baltobacteraceae bacterium]
MRSCILSIALAVVVTTSVARADEFATFVARTAAANLKATGAASVSVGVMRGSRIVLTTAFGRSRLQPNVRATDTTTYNVGSITKQFTAAAILMLAQERKLSLSDPISKYVPTAFS